MDHKPLLEDLSDKIGIELGTDQIPIVEKIEPISKLWLRTPGIQLENDTIIGISLPYIKQEVNLDSLFQIKSLRVLGLSTDKIAKLPDSLGNLKSLKMLDLESNLLETLPESIGKLKSLQILNLGYNQLKTLPESTGSLKSLQNLNLLHNKLETLPESIVNLKSLQSLQLQFNQLAMLPKSLGNLESLRMLYLNNNQLKTVPRTLWKLKNLSVLNIMENPLTDEYTGVSLTDAKDFLDFCRKRATINLFLSHAVDDFEKYHLQELIRFLESKEEISKVYYCEEDLMGNIDEWMLEKVPQSQLLLFLASKKSVYDSSDCRNELDLADKHLIPAIPIKSEELAWAELAELKIARELGLEFNKGDFDQFCEELYRYIHKFKREVDLLERDQRYLGIAQIYERFRIEFKELEERLSKKISKLQKELDSLKE